MKCGFYYLCPNVLHFRPLILFQRKNKLFFFLSDSEDMKFLITFLFISLAVAAVLAQDETESTTTAGTETATGGHGHGHVHGGEHGHVGHGKRGISILRITVAQMAVRSPHDLKVVGSNLAGSS